MKSHNRYGPQLFGQRKVALARPSVELSHEESIPSAIERDNLRLEEIRLRLANSQPTETGWPIQPDERRALEAEADGIRSLHAWYGTTRDLLFSMSTGPLDTTFVMRLESSAPDAATAERLRVLEAAAGVETPQERERTGTKALWSVCCNRVADLPGRITMFAGMLVTNGYIPADHGVGLHPPDDVKRNALAYAEQAERETAGVIRASILSAVREHAADRAFGDPSISEDIIRRTAASQAERDALGLYNANIGASGEGLTVDYLRSWVKKLASKGLLSKTLSIPGLGDIVAKARGLR
jgi:hypothetical protein